MKVIQERVMRNKSDNNNCIVFENFTASIVDLMV
jgi:hypothetical protein